MGVVRFRAMAAFTGESDETVRLDYRILQNGAVCLYFRPHILQEDIDWLRQQTYDVHELDCARWTSEAEFHTAVSESLSFPDWYGRNLHAFNDSLSDIVVPDEGGTALVFQRFDLFAARDPTAAWHILDIIEVNSRRFSLFGKRLIALVQSDDPAISFSPVGACPVMWNPREWLNKHRGS
jgi:RNAse (barnase) inhibitor barstar